MNKSVRFFLTAAGILVAAQIAWAHAFLDHAEPAVGGKIHGSPAAVRVWFSEKLEPALCKLQVFDESGQEVDKREPPSLGEPTMLTVALLPLRPGKYKVVWRAVSVDTHVTSGDFKFEVTL